MGQADLASSNAAMRWQRSRIFNFHALAAGAIFSKRAVVILKTLTSSIAFPSKSDPDQREGAEDGQIGGGDEIFPQNHGGVHQGKEGHKAKQRDGVSQKNGEISRIAQAKRSAGGDHKN